MLLISLLISCLSALVYADQFTNPSNSVTDLSTTYYLGESINVAWESSVSDITLVVSVWGGKDVGVLLCMSP